MIILGLGSNLGDREGHILAALDALDAHPQISLEQTSSFYQTAPVGYSSQPDFLNAVVSIATTLSPLELLDVCLATEKQLGRVRTKKWGPRTIDIDILIFNEVSCQSDQLDLPHPRIKERCFVLVPLVEIAADVPLLDGLTPRELLSHCNAQPVHLYKQLTRREHSG